MKNAHRSDRQTLISKRAFRANRCGFQPEEALAVQTVCVSVSSLAGGNSHGTLPEISGCE
jgi:hypothetical protein